MKWATSAFPSTKDYAHYRFVDYGTLTIVGVAGACLAWFAITRVTSSPRWLFFRLAVTVMFGLWIPDLYLFVRGEPTSAVLSLMLMHLVIALVTYNALVHLAPVRQSELVNVGSPSWSAKAVTDRSEKVATHGVSRGAWTTMMMLVGAEMLIGFAELLSVVPTVGSSVKARRSRSCTALSVVFSVVAHWQSSRWRRARDASSASLR